jgi:hypothetical protein
MKLDLTLYDGVEVHPVVREFTQGIPIEYFEITHPDDPKIYCWSVYLHLIDGGVECIADCPTQETALLIADVLEQKLKVKP